MTYVYLLISINNPQKVYIGKTHNLEERLAEHKRSESSYSKTYAPWRLETYIAFSDEKLAHAFEKYLKAGSAHAFMKKRFLPKPVE
jgi:predicted GIY-YIG superfamily endonuclease